MGSIAPDQIKAAERFFMARTIDENCIACHGTGEVMSERQGYTLFSECFCVEYHYSERQREMIAKAVASLQPQT